MRAERCCLWPCAPTNLARRPCETSLREPRSPSHTSNRFSSHSRERGSFAPNAVLAADTFSPEILGRSSSQRSSQRLTVRSLSEISENLTKMAPVITRDSACSLRSGRPPVRPCAPTSMGTPWLRLSIWPGDAKRGRARLTEAVRDPPASPPDLTEAGCRTTVVPLWRDDRTRDGQHAETDAPCRASVAAGRRPDHR